VSHRIREPIRVLFLGKNTSRGGSMRVLSYILKFMDKKKFSPFVIVEIGGDLLADYRNYSTTYVYSESVCYAVLKVVRKIVKNRWFPAIFRVFVEPVRLLLERLLKRQWIHSKIRACRPDLMVYCYHGNIQLFEMVKNNTIPSVQNIHLYGLALNRLGDIEINKIVNRADHFICEGKNVRDYAHDCLGIQPERTSTVCIGIDLSIREKQLSRSNRVQRSDLGLNDTDLVISACGPINYHKGVYIWLKAAKILLVRHSSDSLKFLWIGGTAKQMKSVYGRSVRRLCEELQLNSQVIFLGDQSFVYPYLNMCDIYVQPSRDDAFPHAILEAMAISKPSVSFRQGIAVEDYAQGALICVDITSPEALAAGVSELIENPKLRRKFGNSARNLIHERFEVTETVRAYQNVLSEVVAKADIRG
jgi:glycosyltransferase involved in cell wall biosynthesis